MAGVNEMKQCSGQVLKEGPVLQKVINVQCILTCFMLLN